MAQQPMNDDVAATTAGAEAAAKTMAKKQGLILRKHHRAPVSYSLLQRHSGAVLLRHETLPKVLSYLTANAPRCQKGAAR
jgi:hypothetical protein